MTDRTKFIISMPLVCWRRRGEISLKDERKYEWIQSWKNHCQRTHRNFKLSTLSSAAPICKVSQACLRRVIPVSYQGHRFLPSRGLDYKNDFIPARHLLPL
jgi:hypothetical protein